MIPLIRLLHLIQNVVTLVQFGCKGDIWSSCFHTFIDRIFSAAADPPYCDT